MHAQRATKAILERFSAGGEPELDCGAWHADCRGVATKRGPVDLSVQLSAAPEVLLVDGMSANPYGRGGGTMLLEALADYCRPLGLQLSLHALRGTEGFYRTFSWLIETPPGSRNFRTSW
jgi:hypothetical protein